MRGLEMSQGRGLEGAGWLPGRQAQKEELVTVST